MSDLRGQRILVTGATGFIGRRLCARLVDQGCHVLAAVRRSSTVDVLPATVETVQVSDIGPDTDWSAALVRPIDAAVHLAARVHVFDNKTPDSIAAYRRVNASGTERLAQAAAGRCSRFVFVSTAHAMCTLSDQVLTESSDCRPSTAYGQSKLEAEARLRDVAESASMETVVLRPPPVYGPGSVGNLMRLFRAIERGWPLPLSRVFSRRSLIYVENMVDVLVASLEHPDAAGQTFLVSDGDDVSLPELIRLVSAALGRPARVVPTPVPLLKLAGWALGKRDAVDRLLGSLAVDSRKIRDELGWTPPHSLIDGVRATAGWISRSSGRAA